MRTSPHLLKSKSHAIRVLACSLLLLSFYKIFKYILSQYLAVSPLADYYLYESYNSIFRLLNSILGIALGYWSYKNFLPIFKTKNNKTAILLFSYLAVFLSLNLIFFRSTATSLYHFSNELIFNSLTGVSEELLFRALVLISLVQLIGIRHAILATAFLFSLFHYDVVSQNTDYLHLFLASIVYSLAFLKGAGLAFVMAIHFAWDQIHFGWIWNSNMSWLYIICLLVNEVIFIFLLYKNTDTKKP